MNKTPELVDLGLPSGNLWFKCNLGASKETESGLVYQWGSLVSYQGEVEKLSLWNACPFNNGKNDFDEKYFLKNRYKWIYKNNNLKPEYDAVTQMYGKGFKIPTDRDLQELLDNTIMTVTTEEGKFFTSNINGNSIFIPFIKNSRWSNIWSATIHIYFCLAYSLSFSNKYENAIAGVLSSVRTHIFPIRGIRVKDE